MEKINAVTVWFKGLIVLGEGKILYGGFSQLQSHPLQPSQVHRQK